MKILSLIQPVPGVEVGDKMYTTVDLLINGRPPDPSYTFVVEEGEYILVGLARNTDSLQECCVMADWLEDQGCPREWTDKLRGFNQS